MVAGRAGLRVLGVDPGLAGTGWGLVEAAPGGVAVVASGVIATGAGLGLDVRVHLIYERVDAVLAEHVPGVLVLEDLYAAPRFPRAALALAHARGVICLAARQRSVTVLALAPAEVKRAIAASGAAVKVQMQAGVQRLLRLPAPPRPAHVADALALALTGFSRLGGRLA